MRVILFVLLLILPKAPQVAADELFVRVKSLLSDRCYQCHGPDEHSRQAGLRLDLKNDALNVIEVGDPESSELFARIMSDDATEVMPPPESKLELNSDEKELIRSWIEQGAQWKNHWAFEPLPNTVDVPEVTDQRWLSNAIDAFVLATLESKQMRPSKESEPWQWLRRVSFDLTGLPPTNQQIDEFQRDRSADAYSNAIDRLLASPAYGEHMAAAWLDAARYADSYGYQSDKLNTQWPYRDWVIKAFNDNLAYDDFVTWQLAGDLLDNRSRDQRLATAFNRLHRMNNEGGAVFEEWRIESIADRVNTYGTAILGLTVECARCHDHKFDPISTRDYYSLFAFFNSIDENGLYDQSAKVPSPSMLLPTDEQVAILEKNKQLWMQKQQELNQQIQTANKRWLEWKTSVADSLELPKPILMHKFDAEVAQRDLDMRYPSTDDRARTNEVPLVKVNDCPIPDVDQESEERLAAQFDGDRGYTFRGITAFDRWTPFSLVITLKDTERSPLRTLIAHHSRGTDAGYNGWDLTLVDGYIESRIYRVWPGNALGVRSKTRLPVNQWCQLSVTFDGSSTAQGLQIFVNGKLLDMEILRDKCIKRANGNVAHGGQFVVGQRFRSKGFTAGLIDSFQLFDCELTPTELAHLATGSKIEPTLAYFVQRLDEQASKARIARKEAIREFVSAEEQCLEIPIMEDLPDPLPAHVLARGQYDAPTSDATRVHRKTFDHIGFIRGAEYRKDRLGLAHWTTHPNHPLTSRVFVNRLWINFFGRGLVQTSEDFGVQSSPPSHPRLLNWLSRRFIDDGWDIKAICKLIALSSTYRQASTASAESLEVDPENIWLARGPAYRLSAEQIRDMALAASGLLNRKMGGPPVSPYQPGGDLWRESNGMSPPYRQSVGVALHRRSIYSVIKRTAPLPNMIAFDASSREVCTVNRSRTNTPLQAMVLLNDPQFVEAARNLAEQQLKNEHETDGRLRGVFRAVTSRDPDRRESELLASLLDDEVEYYSEHPEEAKKLCVVGDTEYDKTLDTGELAAWTTVCQAIMNLDAAVWKR